MGHAARANQIAQQARAGTIKPMAKETEAQKRDRLRATLPGYTRMSMLKHLGIDSGIVVAQKDIVAKVRPKRKLTINKVED